MRALFSSVCFLSFFALPVSAATYTETRLLPDHTNYSGLFGTSVDMTESVLAVGAPGSSNRGYPSIVYLFDPETGDRIGSLSSEDVNEPDQYGTSLALADDRIVVGASGNDGAADNGGAAYVYDVNTGTELFKLTASDASKNALFGDSVAMNKNVIAVGAGSESGLGKKTGAVYLFDATTGTELRKITATDPSDQDRLGETIAMNDSTLLASARDDENGNNSGSVYVYDLATGEQTGKLLPEDGQPRDGFGTSISIMGNIAAVGARGEDEANTDAGAVYLFDLMTGSQIAKLVPSDPLVKDFGASVDMSGNVLIVGATQTDTHSGIIELRTGSAHLFDLTTLTEFDVLVPSEGETDDSFGASVAIYGETAAVGASFDWALPYDHHGSTYLYSGIPNSNETNPTSPVPLPAGVWLLGSALGLIALNRRRS